MYESVNFTFIVYVLVLLTLSLLINLRDLYTISRYKLNPEICWYIKQILTSISYLYKTTVCGLSFSVTKTLFLINKFIKTNTDEKFSGVVKR